MGLRTKIAAPLAVLSLGLGTAFVADVSTADTHSVALASEERVTNLQESSTGISVTTGKGQSIGVLPGGMIFAATGRFVSWSLPRNTCASATTNGVHETLLGPTTRPIPPGGDVKVYTWRC